MRQSAAVKAARVVVSCVDGPEHAFSENGTAIKHNSRQAVRNFHFKNLLSKLWWEIEKLHDTSLTVEVEGYHCFDAAVTAWHLTDWVCKEFHQAEFKTVAVFQDIIRKRSKYLALCDQLANGSKHFERDGYDRPEVSSKVEPAMAVIRTRDGRLQFKSRNSIFVHDGEDQMVPTCLFMEAHSFWHNHIAGLLPR